MLPLWTRSRQLLDKLGTKMLQECHWQQWHHRCQLKISRKQLLLSLFFSLIDFDFDLFATLLLPYSWCLEKKSSKLGTWQKARTRLAKSCLKDSYGLFNVSSLRKKIFLWLFLKKKKSRECNAKIAVLALWLPLEST